MPFLVYGLKTPVQAREAAEVKRETRHMLNHGSVAQVS